MTLALVIGCPHAKPPPANFPLLTTTNREAEADLRTARQHQEAGELDEASAAYEQFLATHPTDPLTASARIGLAQIHIADDDGLKAREVLTPIADHEDAAVRERAQFYLGVAAQRIGEHDLAISTLTPMLGRMVDPLETALLLISLADAHLARGDIAEGLRTLDRLMVATVHDAAREEAQTRIERIVASITPNDLPTVLAALDPTATAWPMLVRRELIEADAAHNNTRVRQLLALVQEHAVTLDSQSQEIALRASRAPEADPQVVGVVLTLSGRAREVGELALRGLMLAAGLPPSGPQPAGAPQLIFRDDGGDPARAVQAIDELVTVHRAIAIIGPMNAAVAYAAAEHAQELGVPLITLTPQQDITRARDVVFRMFTSPQEEASALIAYATARGKRRVCLLRPDNAYGALMDAAFRTAIEAHQAQLASATTYAAGATSFGRDLSTLAAAECESVVIADTSRTVELVAPALAAAGLWSALPDAPPPTRGRGVLLLTPSVGFHSQLTRTVGRYLQGAVFSVPFHPAALSGADRGFVDRYQKQFESAPDAFAAVAHDAYKLVRAAVDRGARTRAALSTALTRTETPTAAGPSRGLSAERAPRTPTRLVMLSGTDLVPVSQ